MNNSEPALNNGVDNYLAALDIGSNSFHFVLARSVNNHIQILHTEKYQAKLADGLSEDKTLSSEAISRGVNILANLAATTEHLTKENFRAVATFTLREAKNTEEFLKEAAKVFPFDIEIISGHEEARLIYQAVNNLTHSKNTRLV
jgi:exopolyphosphatase/guanosine-5'-triphosphate,3'-diphosphate pyrophosphatase